ncbi:MAG TPA: hypothetical protein VFC32_10885 [Pseudolabrys sp.]|nr:hypothetical protein [Pseudolabrys sp.]
MAKRAGKESDGKSEGWVELSVPWTRGDVGLQNAQFYSRNNNAANFSDEEFAKLFVKQRSQVHEAFIRESAKTKRLGYGLSATLLGGAFIVPVFAPLGRETLSWWVSAALFVFAAGAVGYTKVSLKTKEQKISLSGPTKDD